VGNLIALIQAITELIKALADLFKSLGNWKSPSVPARAKRCFCLLLIIFLEKFIDEAICFNI
jgi:hypothetical protein